MQYLYCHTRIQLGISAQLKFLQVLTCKLGHEVAIFPEISHPPDHLNIEDQFLLGTFDHETSKHLVLTVAGGCLEGVWRVSCGCLDGV